MGVALSRANRWTDVTRLTNTPTNVKLFLCVIKHHALKAYRGVEV
jgi:hypothetical protein